MKRHITFTLTVEIDETTFGDDPALAAQELADFDEIILPDIARSLGAEAVRILAFHAEQPVLADTREVISKPFDPTLEPF